MLPGRYQRACDILRTLAFSSTRLHFESKQRNFYRDEQLEESEYSFWLELEGKKSDYRFERFQGKSMFPLGTMNQHGVFGSRPSIGWLRDLQKTIDSFIGHPDII